jgi:hypothetical protein
MKRPRFACGNLIALIVLLNAPAYPADDDDASTGTIHPGDIVTTIAEAWGLALQVAIRRTDNRNALHAAIERETVEATRRFGTIACSTDGDGGRDPLALLARRHLDEAIAALRSHLAITYQSRCIAGRLAVTFDVKVIGKPP